MDQRQLAADALEHLYDIPATPAGGNYLSLARAQEIVDATIRDLQAGGDGVELGYLVTHRKRLAVSLCMIPMAQGPDASCIDIGCYGYMAHWCRTYLGYARVAGIEIDPTCPDPVLLRRVSVAGATTEYTVYNFDLALEYWPFQEQFDTVLMFETLEHVATDHMGVMLRVKDCMKSDGRLVMSVPNAVSHKTLQEFMSGNPPWVYWFFHPDITSEPRHQFEYTPFVLKTLIRAAGLRELAFRTIFAFVEEDSVAQAIGIGADMGIPQTIFGDTMFVQAEKDFAAEVVRYPAVLYDAAAYYEHVHPLVWDRLSAAFASYNRRADDLRKAEEDRQRLAVEVEAERQRLSAEVEAERQRLSAEVEAERQSLTAEIEQERKGRAEVVRELEATQQDVLKMLKGLGDANLSLSTASEAVANLRIYLAQAEAERDRLAGEVARGTADLAAARSAIMVNQRDTMSLLDGIEATNQMLLTAQNTLASVYASRSWRLTAPIRRLTGGNPGLRRIAGRIYRTLRRG